MHPRIVLSRDAERCQREAAVGYAPHNDVIRRHLPDAEELYVNASSMTWQFQPFAAAA